MEAVVLHRVGFLAYPCPKQGQDFKPSAAPLYPNMGQVPPPRGETKSLSWETSSLEVERKGDGVTCREKSDFKLNFLRFILR